MDYFISAADYPFMAEIARDPRFRRILAAIESDNKVMRDRFLQWRRAKAEAAR